MSQPDLATPVTWNNLKLEYVGPLSLDYDLDSKDRNARLKITNVGTTTVENISFQIAIQGLGDYPKVTGDGGFAVFPNGGNIDLAPGESYVAQNWLQGIYEGRFGNSPPASGQTKTYSVDFILATDNAAFQRANPTADPVLAGKLTQQIAFTRSDYGPNEFRTTTSAELTNGQTLSGTIATPNGPLTGLTVEIATPYSRWYTVDVRSTATQASFATSVPVRNDWMVRITAEDVASRTFTAAQLSEAGPVTLSAVSDLSFGYQLAKTAVAPVGYWRGAVSESEKTVVLIPGQENWSDPGDDAADAALRARSLIRKYSFSGELLWEYAPGWETWGGDMSADGSRVVYLVTPDISRYRAGDWKLGVLNGRTGELLWSVTGQVPYLEGLEASVSPDGRYVAAGSSQGALGVHDGSTGAQLWQKVAGTFGQVRKLLFVGEHLYVGSGDGFLVKLVAATGAQVWKAFVGGWPFVNGLDVNETAGLIAVGTKSKDTSVVDALTGEVLWSRQTGSLDAVISPDGNHVANFYGDIFNARTGALVGQTGVGATVLFSPDSQYVIQADRGLVTIADLSGKVLSRIVDSTDTQAGSGEQAQWSYLSDDGTTLIVASRDMDTPGERALAIWTRGDPVVSSGNSSGGASGGTGQNGGSTAPASNSGASAGNDRLTAQPGVNQIDGLGGVDTVVYSLRRADFQIVTAGDNTVVRSSNGVFVNALKNVERIQFQDTSVALDLTGNAGITARILGALAGKQALNNKAYVGIGLDLLDKGMSVTELAGLAIETLGIKTNDQLVTTLWTNIAGALPTAANKAPYLQMLDNGLAMAEFARLAVESGENAASIGLVGLLLTGIEYQPVV
jgi:WD40 repeat protein